MGDWWSKGDGLYNSKLSPWVMYGTTVYPPHVPWVAQPLRWCTYPMDHGLYNAAYSHDTWIVHWFRGYAYPMIHGLYNPVCVHDPWVVQSCIYPWHMDCTTLHAYPWAMSCTMLYISMIYGLYNRMISPGPGLCNGIYIPWPSVIRLYPIYSLHIAP